MSGQPRTHDHVDVLIVGAGLSGIGAARHLQANFPGRTFAILESRANLGGTWDLFRYPGVRSDSDMQTLGYRFRPWRDDIALADGEQILDYLTETAAETGVDEHIHYDHRVLGASWSSADARWTVDVATPDGPATVTATFLHGCTGYYRYDAGYQPEFAGTEDFTGTLVHPQAWPEDLEYAGRRVVVIGSGATAVTLVPAMAPDAAHVTMLQRSPSYVLPVPRRDGIAGRLRGLLNEDAAYRLTRWKNVATITALYQLSQRYPGPMRRLIRRANVASLPEGYDVDTHFHPEYGPWDQRLCLVPDGDLFKAISRGQAEVVTDRIDRFVPEGIRLASGRTLEADIVVTATGLRLQMLGGLDLEVDGEPVDLPSTLAYRGMMLSGVPNFVFTVGYTNASWTLKADLVSDFFARVVRRLDRGAEDYFVPTLPEAPMETRPLLDFEAGYVKRSLHEIPRSGVRQPWRLGSSYLQDALTLRRARLDDGALRFHRRGPADAVPDTAAEQAVG